jgi:hypothetical protein
LHVLDEAALDVTSPVEIELQVGHGRLEIFVSQAVLDVRDGLPSIEEIHGPAVPEGVNRIDVLQTLRGQRPGEVLQAEAVNPVAGELFPTLTDEEPVLIDGLGGDSIFFDVKAEKLNGPPLQVYESEAVPFAEDRQGVLLGVEVVQIEGGDLGSPVGSGPLCRGSPGCFAGG